MPVPLTAKRSTTQAHATYPHPVLRSLPSVCRSAQFPLAATSKAPAPAPETCPKTSSLCLSPTTQQPSPAAVLAVQSVTASSSLALRTCPRTPWLRQKPHPCVHTRPLVTATIVVGPLRHSSPDVLG